jgi:hypothetical protein
MTLAPAFKPGLFIGASHAATTSTVQTNVHFSNRSRSSFSFSFSRSGEDDYDYENENEPDMGSVGCGEAELRIIQIWEPKQKPNARITCSNDYSTRMIYPRRYSLSGIVINTG